jgi:small-conductance mechanosensitive channel
MQQLVKERFDAEGISIPFPQRSVHLEQANPDLETQKRASIIDTA